MFRDAMREHVGRGKLWSVEALAEETGIKPRTLRSYLEGTQPSYPNAVTIMACMPPAFMVTALEGSGIIAVETASSETICARRLHAGVGQLNHTLTEARADGRIDHREMARIQRDAGWLVNQIYAFFSGRARA